MDLYEILDQVVDLLRQRGRGGIEPEANVEANASDMLTCGRLVGRYRS